MACRLLTLWTMCGCCSTLAAAALLHELPQPRAMPLLGVTRSELQLRLPRGLSLTCASATTSRRTHVHAHTPCSMTRARAGVQWTSLRPVRVLRLDESQAGPPLPLLPLARGAAATMRVRATLWGPATDVVASESAGAAAHAHTPELWRTAHIVLELMLLWSDYLHPSPQPCAMLTLADAAKMLRTTTPTWATPDTTHAHHRSVVCAYSCIWHDRPSWIRPVHL